MSTVDQDNLMMAVVRVESTGQSLIVREGDRFFIGTSDGADITVQDEEVAAIHCVINAEIGALTVQDYYSQAGTFVNQQKVSECTLTSDAVVQIGGVTLNIEVLEAESQTSEAPTFAEPASEPSAEPEVIAEEPQQQPELSPLLHGPDEAAQQRVDEMLMELEQANAEIEVLQNRLTSISSEPGGADPFQDEMIELLKAEIIELQTELANSQSSPSGSTVQPTDEETLSREESERLVARLEELLAELEDRDDHVATLTGLLKAAEDTGQAEQEERQQLVSWLDDIESRFGQREGEWEAQRSGLMNRIESLTAERDNALAAMNTDSSNAKLEAAQNVMVRLRDALEQERSRVNEYEEKIASLQSELETAQTFQTQEQLAEIAEQKAELARKREEMEQERFDLRQKASRDADLKVRALRDHLREIHSNEQKEQEEKKLSSRIARLWRRMDR